MATRLVVVGDMHLGSKFALCKSVFHWPSTEHREGGSWHANEDQLDLFRLWKRCSLGRWHKPDVLVALGDMIDGQDRKSRGVWQWTTDPGAQADAAVELLEMWEAQEIWCVDGSGYHSEVSGFSVDRLVAERAGAKRTQSGEICPFHLYLPIEGLTAHFAHHVGTSQLFHYKSTPLAREMWLTALHDDMKRYAKEFPETTLVFRGHAHDYVHLEFPSSAGWIIPGWQVRTPWTMKKSVHGFTPRIGFVGVEIKGRKWSYEPFIWSVGNIGTPPVGIIGKKKGGARRARV